MASAFRKLPTLGTIILKMRAPRLKTSPLLFVFQLFFMLSLGWCSPLLANSLEDRAEVKIDTAMYEAKVPAPAPIDGPDDQPKLIQQAFKDMLIRLSGSEKVINHATVVKALTEIDNYVTQFGFQIDAQQERVLRVRFDEKLCRDLLKNAGQPILGAKRPPVVLWLAMQKDNITQWVTGDIQNELSHSLEALAEKRGLTLVQPLLDLTDTSIVSEQQVWDEDLIALQTASKRYNAEHILIGKLNKQPSGWYAQWTYVKQGNSVRWDMSNVELVAVFGEALDEFSNRLSSEALLATTLGLPSETGALVDQKTKANPSQNIAHRGTELQSNTLRLAIAGVSGGEQYAKVLKYLKSLPAVKEVDVAEITPEQTVFTIDTTASREMIMDSIAAGQLLMENIPETQTSKEMLNYKLVGLL